MIDPRGTPQLRICRAETICPCWTLWARYSKKDRSQTNARLPVPKSESIPSRILWSEVSKATEMLRRTTKDILPRLVSLNRYNKYGNGLDDQCCFCTMTRREAWLEWVQMLGFIQNLKLIGHHPLDYLASDWVTVFRLIRTTHVHFLKCVHCLTETSEFQHALHGKNLLSLLKHMLWFISFNTRLYHMWSSW